MNPCFLLTCAILSREEYFFRGWNSIGIASNPQPNAGFPNGAFYGTISLNFDNQSRSSSDIGHYREVVGTRPNYHLLPGYLVTKILFDKNKKANAVHVSHFGTMKVNKCHNNPFSSTVHVSGRQNDFFRSRKP